MYIHVWGVKRKYNFKQTKFVFTFLKLHAYFYILVDDFSTFILIKQYFFESKRNTILVNSIKVYNTLQV